MPTPTLPLDVYKKLFHKCLQKRVPVEKFESYFSQLLSRSPIPATAIASAILASSVTSNTSDPLHLSYVSRLVERDILSLGNVLTALLKSSPAKASTSDEAFHHDGDYMRNREMLEQDVFLVLANILRQHKPRMSENVWAAVQAMSDWMEVVVTASGLDVLGDPEGLAEAAMAADVVTKSRSDALGEMVMALGMNEAAAKLLMEGSQSRKLAFQTNLGLFAQYIQAQHPSLASKLEFMRQHIRVPAKVEGGRHHSPRQQKSMLKDQTIDGIMMDLGGDYMVPQVYTRTHLFVWMDSLLCGRPHGDDEIILAYLYNRYREDANTMVTDFVTAVIDVISNALVRSEPPSTLFLLRSFLCNKVPLILNRISPSSLTSSYAISQTLHRSDVSPLMSLAPALFEPYTNNSNTDMFGDITVDLRQDFLFACALHGVIGEQDIQGILGELPLGAMPGSGRYDYRDILAQCASEPSRVDRLLEEIESVEGNSGAVVRALFEVMKNMCDHRETMPLRSICSFLARKPSSIDVMLLFIKPAEMLEPLCDLLDGWRYEEDQGEYQPVYEEFGYILLLVLTLIHRYSFTASDLAFSHPPKNEAFIPQLLSEFSTAQRIETLNSDQLGGWIKELFEGEGISDGLMMACRPQEFYRLVPTIFSQSLLAIQRGVLDLDTVKEAFAFLLTPFLLPSVISGLTWLAQHLWSNLDSPTSTLSILSSLIIAHDLTPETAETHRTVVAISARPLDAVLHELLRRPDISQDIAHTTRQLLSHLRPHLGFKRTATPTREEVEGWVHSAGSGGLVTALANNYNQLLLWNEGLPPVQYTTRLLATTWKLLGARRVVEVLCAEAAKAKLPGHAGVAEDVAAAFLAAFVGEEGRISLREALVALVAESESEDGTAETVMVEIMRRVEAAHRHWVGPGVGDAQHVGGEHVDLGAMGLGVGVDDGMDLMMEHADFGGGMGLLEGMEM